MGVCDRITVPTLEIKLPKILLINFKDPEVITAYLGRENSGA